MRLRSSYAWLLCFLIPHRLWPPILLNAKNEGIQATAVGTQIAKEATQQAVGKQSNVEAGRDVVITEQELAAQGETVNIDQRIPPWVLLLLIIGWIAPSPNEMVCGFYNLIAVLRGKIMDNKELMDLLHRTLAENLLSRVKDPEAKSADLNVARQFLKDNGIDALPVENSPLSDLVKSLPDFADEDTDLSEMKLN